MSRVMRSGQVWKTGWEDPGIKVGGWKKGSQGIKKGWEMVLDLGVDEPKKPLGSAKVKVVSWKTTFLET